MELLEKPEISFTDSLHLKKKMYIHTHTRIRMQNLTSLVRWKFEETVLGYGKINARKSNYVCMYISIYMYI